MPRSAPHPLALFSLVPTPNNEAARRVIALPDNKHLVSTLPDGALGLEIGFHLRGNRSETLATLGRGIDVDIYIDAKSIARIQCSFEIDLDTGVVMFCDRSFANSSQFFGDDAIPFEYGRERKLVVQEGINSTVGMGGSGCDRVQFGLWWHQSPEGVVKAVKSYDNRLYGKVQNPRLGRTIDDEPTEPPSRRETRPHTPGANHLKMRFAPDRVALGAGQFGEVYKAIDVDSGRLMAVKILHRPTGNSKKATWAYYALKREVEALASLDHPHIVDYIASQGWDGSQVHIFMGLKEGTLHSLVESGAGISAIAESVFPQMLRALDCIAHKGIIHRDVKPENIMYNSPAKDCYRFQLGDFGLCNRATIAQTDVGTPLFKAPEMLEGREQTEKVDVWSLFVTMMWTLDAGDFRQKANSYRTYPEVRSAVAFAAFNVDSVSNIRDMAAVDPAQRASAAQMLVRHYNGVGLSTPRNRVPTLVTDQNHTVDTEEASISESISQTTKGKSREFQRGHNEHTIVTTTRTLRSRTIRTAMAQQRKGPAFTAAQS